MSSCQPSDAHPGLERGEGGRLAGCQRIVGGVGVPAAHKVGQGAGGGVRGERVVVAETVGDVVVVGGPRRVAVSEGGQPAVRRRVTWGPGPAVEAGDDGDLAFDLQHPAADRPPPAGRVGADPHDQPPVGDGREGRGAGRVRIGGVDGLAAVGQGVGQGPVQVDARLALRGVQLGERGGQQAAGVGGVGARRALGGGLHGAVGPRAGRAGPYHQRVDLDGDQHPGPAGQAGQPRGDHPGGDAVGRCRGDQRAPAGGR